MCKSIQLSRRSFLQRRTMAAAAAGLPLWFVQCALAAAKANKDVYGENRSTRRAG
jgi:uncharacterized protein (DUF1501 family)